MIPKYVYHYTTIKSLKEIIKSGNIRFTRLDLLNDPFEGAAKIDGECIPVNSRELIYCSCWSAQIEESISMWGVYGKFDGVRIKFRSDLFAEFLELVESTDGFIPYGKIAPIDSGDRTTVENKEIPIKKVYGPIHVKYLDDENIGIEANKADIETTSSRDYYMIHMLDLGNRKNKYWQYEDEWRYKITAYSDSVADKNVLKKGNNRVGRKEYIDIPFCKRIEEVVLGPQVTSKDSIDLEKFLLSYGYDKVLKPSVIRMR